VLGGSVGRDSATAAGAVNVLEAYLASTSRTISGLRVAIHGFGNAGATIAKLLHAAGAIIVGVSDSQGSLLSAQGLNPNQIEQHKKHGMSVLDVYCRASVCDNEAMSRDGVEAASSDAVLGVSCDVLIPAALDNVIHASNVDVVRASIVLELANNPVTPEAAERLAARSVVVIPDVLANAGGVVVSYFEWVQNRQQMAWSSTEVSTKLQMIMKDAFMAVNERAESETSYRAAAYQIGVERIAQAMTARSQL
jgi:glutamate dehydrogenase (NADP+)